MIISFYSYKGGVGRSQLCANLASYLCHRKGKKILLMDWDFEAPGLHYFFHKSNADIQTNGTIELLEAYTQMMRTKSDISENDYHFFDPKSIIHLKKSESNGVIDIIPAGNYNERYTFKVNTFDWYEFYELLDGKSYIESFKKWIKTLDYDFVFIDSRTGINDYSGICNIQLPDANVVVMAANDQNIDGCKRIIDQILNSEYTKQGYRKAYIFPILSRINTNHLNYNDWAEKFTKAFHQLVSSLDNEIDSHFTKDVFKNFYLDKTLLADESQFSAGENLLIKDKKQTIPRNSFASKFANIGDYILKITNENSIGIAAQIDIETWLLWAMEAEEKNEIRKAIFAYQKAGFDEKSISLGGNADAFFSQGYAFAAKGEKDKAIEYYQKAIDIKPDSYDALNNLGVIFNDKGDLGKAIEYWQKAIQTNPNYHTAFSNMGIVFSRQGDHDKAIEYYQKAIDIDPNKCEIFMNMGNAFKYKSDFDKAIECYQKALEIDPKKYDALNNMGNAYSEKNEHDKAIECYQKAIDINPNQYEIFNNLAISYRDKSDFNKAIKYYQKAIDIDPNQYDTLNNMGNAYSEKNEYDKAIECYQKAIEINPNKYDALNNMGNAYSEKNEHDKAIECYQKAIDINPNQYEIFNNLAISYRDKSDFDKAIKYYQKAIDIDPNQYDVFNNIGNTYSDKKDYDKAIEYYQKAIDIDPNQYDVFNNIGNAYSDKKDYDKAIEYYQKAIDIDPDKYDAFFNISLAYNGKDDNVRAIEYCQKAININPNFHQGYNSIGFGLIKLGKLKEARTFLLKGVNLGNSDFSLMNLGHIYLAEGNEEQALLSYLQSLSGFANKDTFWNGMKDDFQYLKQYDITQEQYDLIQNKIEQQFLLENSSLMTET